MKLYPLAIVLLALSLGCAAFAEPPESTGVSPGGSAPPRLGIANDLPDNILNDDLLAAPPARLQEPAKPDIKQSAASAALLKLASDKFAGKQLWTDELLFHDFRIQRNAIDDTCCLIDGQDQRITVGDFAACQVKLSEIKRDRKLPGMQGKVVLVLHGLGRTRNSSVAMAKYLEKKGRMTAMTFGYASTRDDIATQAKSLARVIENLDGVTEINFVAHSLGNLVIRHYLADHTDPALGLKPDPRIKRIVMVAAPNNGALMAELFLRNRLSEAVIGEPGQALARGWEDLHKHLAIPECEFGVIAGGRNNEQGYNPLLPGDDDLVVSVEEVRLAGARDFLLVSGVHARMMENVAVQEAALRFLKRGYFVSEKRRQPIEK